MLKGSIPKNNTNEDIDSHIIGAIKMLALDMINQAGSGHPGIVLSAAPLIYTIFAKHLKIKHDQPGWIDKDRFVLSAGHGSALLYSTLYISGYKYTLEDLQNFRKLDSKAPGHPEYGHPGIEVTTGPLGQGFANAVGMAIGDAHAAALFNTKKEGLLSNSTTVLDKYTYVLCSDGDLMEGISYESASLAGNLGLGNLIVLYDSNDITLDGKKEQTFTDNIPKRFASMGWEVLKVSDGSDVQGISRAISRAKLSSNTPTLIEVKTIIGKGTSLEGTNKAHGGTVSKEDMALLKQKLNYNYPPFNVSQKAMLHMKQQIEKRNTPLYNDWLKEYKRFTEKADQQKQNQFARYIGRKDVFNLRDKMWHIHNDTTEATRITSGKIMQVISDNMFTFIGGSADLASSNKTYLNNKGNFTKETKNGRNIWFGVREHAMAAILNGIAITGLRPFGSTFLSFSDYLKPSLRLSAMMNLPVTYILTHDTIDVGEDGPTHQPIEQLAMLRSIPNFYTFRPADAKEVQGAWETILNINKPSGLILGRNQTDVQKGTTADGVKFGGYIVSREEKQIHATLVASGSDLVRALKTKEILRKQGIDLRVVSMPSIKLFLIQSKKYQEDTLPKNSRIISIESSSDSIWHRFSQKPEWVINLDSFGASGPKEQVLRKYKMDETSLANKIIELLKQ